MSIGFRLLLTATLPFVAACAVQGGGLPRSTSDVITRAELREASARNLYEAIDRLRPRWLQVRGGSRSFTMETLIVVFQDELYLGNQDQLQRLGTEGVYSVRWVDGQTAQATLSGIPMGTHVDGAIIVSMRAPPGG
jgi:hypothetical protein